MKIILLSSKKYPGLKAKISDRDFKEVKKYKWHPFKGVNSFYAVGRIRGRKLIAMHRFILDLNNEKIEVDHRDSDGLNNRRNNLRIANRAQNSRNQKILKSNTSGFKGVHWHKGAKKWAAQIKFKNRKYHLGYFRDAEKAHKAYCYASTKLHGSFKNFG